MTKAIILPYVVDQNEPSEPLSELVDIPHNTHDAYVILSDVYKETFDLDGEHCGCVALQYRADTGSGFGDITATVPGSGQFLYVTFID